MKFLLFTLLAFQKSQGQDITSILNALNLIKSTPANFLTVAATQGDGSTISLGKIPGPAIQISVTGSFGTQQTIKGTSLVNGYLLMVGDAFCLLQSNITTSIIPAQGSILPIPVNGIVWQCVTQIRNGGIVAGNTPLVNGSIAWP